MADKKAEEKEPAVVLAEATADAGGDAPKAGGAKSGGRIRGAVQGAKDWGAKPASRWWPVLAFVAAAVLAVVGLGLNSRQDQKRSDALEKNLTAQTKILADSLGDVSTAVKGLGTRVTATETGLAENRSAVDALRGEVSSLGARVGAVEGKVTSLETAVGNLPTKDDLRQALENAAAAARAGDEAPKTAVPPTRDANADTAHNAVNALRDEAARLDAENAALRAAAFSRDPHSAGSGGSRNAGPVQP